MQSKKIRGTCDLWDSNRCACPTKSCGRLFPYTANGTMVNICLYVLITFTIVQIVDSCCSSFCD